MESFVGWAMLGWMAAETWRVGSQWKARGLTDASILALGATWIAACVLSAAFIHAHLWFSWVPLIWAVLAAGALAQKVSDHVRARWRRPPRRSAAWRVPEDGHATGQREGRPDPRPPLAQDVAAIEQAAREALERGKGPARMF